MPCPAAASSSYYAEAFALLLLPQSSEAQARQTRERNTCLGYCANFAESPKGEVRRYPILGTSVNKTFVRDAPGVLRWHHGGRRKGFGPVGQGLRPRPKRRRKGSYAHLRGLDQLYGPRNTKRQADHRADRPRRRDRRETRAEVGAGLLDRGTLRHGRRLR